ncbi:hypothetical protein KC19_12G105600 [Ceratodon purpureus]|uniref:Uncharacterized protein n=1 Tax=Ceratodon purpureus TaxID=3225 RepID=A0A8T0G6G6_CERPU|nr:hypothetical protein KC19_12G105600 [Ceratodon purpureus]
MLSRRSRELVFSACAQENLVIGCSKTSAYLTDLTILSMQTRLPISQILQRSEKSSRSLFQSCEHLAWDARIRIFCNTSSVRFRLTCRSLRWSYERIPNWH